MSETYITRIHVKESRNIRDLTIPFSDTGRKHLIITGKNGSGKTSLLMDINRFLLQIDNGNYRGYKGQSLNITNAQDAIKRLKGQKVELGKEVGSTMALKENIDNQIKIYESELIRYSDWFKDFGGIEIEFTNQDSISNDALSGGFLISFFEAKRDANLKVPKGITKFDLKTKYNIYDKANQDFIQYIVNLKADRSFARDNNEIDVVLQIDEWFISLESRLKNLFDSPSLKLIFDRQHYNFKIIEEDKLPFGFNTLADGYSAILSIVTELLLRMEGHNSKAYDMEGVVIIDEIETHLHVDLQKKVLPFLIDFFPKIQFIVSTHSPFVLSSVSNAVICDLESKLVTNDLSGYSYDALIESYFYSDKYSDAIKEKILLYDNLSSQNDLSNNQKDELRILRNYFAHVPKYLSKELMVKLQQIELLNLPKKDLNNGVL